MFERFTDRARRVVVFAQNEARALNHNWIGTEHILLGLIAEGDGVAGKALAHFGVSIERARTGVEELFNRGTQTPGQHIPFTPRAKKVLEYALREAMQLGHNYIGTEHILLGILREARNPSGGHGAVSVLGSSLGVDLTRLHQHVLRILAGYEGKPGLTRADLIAQVEKAHGKATKPRLLAALKAMLPDATPDQLEAALRELRNDG